MSRLSRINFDFCAPAFVGAGAIWNRLPCYDTLDVDKIYQVVVEGEKLGYDGVWVNDHMILGRDGLQLECWTLLSSFAAITDKLRLGPLVICYAYRHPSMIAKMSATLDFISKGRLILGLGAGWHETEAKAYGIPWPTLPIRIAQLRESLELIIKMWTEEKPTYQGKYYQIKDAICNPKPVQKPRPPIIVGAAGKTMLRLVAEFADGWNWNRWDMRLFKQKLEVLRSQCSDMGRSFDSIEKSLETPILIRSGEKELNEVVRRVRDLNPQFPEVSIEDFKRNSLTGTVGKCIKTVEEYVDLGVSRFMFYFLDLPSLEGMRLFAKEVAPSFK